MRRNILSIYHFIIEIFIIFSVMVLFISISGVVMGDYASKYSLYQLGNKGIAYETLFQILAIAIMISVLEIVFISEKIIKNLMTLWRTILFLASILLVMIGFILIFDWFPATDPLPWISFLISFGGCFIISSIFMIIKTRVDNEKYDRLLSEYKEKQSKKVSIENKGNKKV